MDENIWNDTFSNISWDPDLARDTTAQTRLATALASIVCIGIVVSNLLLLAAIIARGGCTKEPYKIILLHLSSLDLSLGLITVPLLIHYMHLGFWNLGEAVCNVLMTLDHFLLVLILVTWLVLSIDRLLFTFRPKRYGSVVKLWVSLLMVWIPWIAFTVISGPLYYMSISDKFVPATECYKEWVIPFYTVFLILTFFMPLGLSLLVMLLAVIALRHSKKTASHRSNSTANGNTRGGIEERRLATTSMVILVVTNWSLAVMCSPFFTLTLVELISGNQTEVENWIISLLNWMVYSNSALRPLLWFVLKDIREGLKIIHANICGTKPRSLDQYTQTAREKEVRFKDFDCSKLKSADV